MAGLVECDWYADCVNLVLQLPERPDAVHVAAGEIVAQAVAIPSALRQPRLDLVEPHRRETRLLHEDLREWRALHKRDRASYKQLSRSRHRHLPEPSG